MTALPMDRLFVRFVDGLTGIVDLSALIASPQAAVFARLRDRSRFEQVHVEMGAVVWPGELDLAPNAMHAAIKGAWGVEDRAVVRTATGSAKGHHQHGRRCHAREAAVRYRGSSSELPLSGSKAWKPSIRRPMPASMALASHVE
ncbi:MAG TPA: DUF2442 domain-containing protein [Acetobacteraceae bacterium]|nr:DUF2442 domain-containing protein [Acetobacteraceae bacterium]